MDAAALGRHRQRLVALKAEIVSEGDVAIEPGRQDPAAVGTDQDGQPLVEMSQTIASSRNRSRSDLLARVTAALARIDAAAAEFGLCAACEEPISPRRLELLPYVELCVDCQAAEDGARRRGGRRHLTDFR
jgi:DnaK suppressor protein